MDSKATPLDPRSISINLPSVSLNSLLWISLLSTSSLLLTEQASSANPALPEDVQAITVAATVADPGSNDPSQLDTNLDAVWETVSLQAEQSEANSEPDLIDPNLIEPGLIEPDLVDTAEPEADWNSDLPETATVTLSLLPLDETIAEWDTLTVDRSLTLEEPLQLSQTEAVDSVLTIIDAEDSLDPELIVDGDIAEQLTEEDRESLSPLETIDDSENNALDNPESIYTSAVFLPTLELAQQDETPAISPGDAPPDPRGATEPDNWQLYLQGVYLLEGDESSARLRVSGNYAFNPHILLGTTLDLTTGDAFFETSDEGFDVNELFLTVSPPTVPELRVTLGMIDLTSYFDRNSFAKDVATHFFNPVFQSNPALVAAGIGSRPGILVNWDLSDYVSIRGATFSSDRDLDEFEFDAAAAEIAVRFGTAIVRATYATNEDSGNNDGFNEIFQFSRGADAFGLQSGDRETSYGINAEVFIPDINLGLFARYGWYENQTLDQGGHTYSFGLNALDLFLQDDRLGLAYGRRLSNERLRQERGDDIPDVVELFYDIPVFSNFRLGVSLQGRDAFSETIAGLRIRGDLDLARLWR